MIVEYMGKQIVVTQKYKDQASAGLSQIEKILGRGPIAAKVVLTADKYRRIADVTVSLGTQSMVATCESADMTMALHDALAKIEQQAVRLRKRTRAIRGPGADSVKKMNPAAITGGIAAAAS